MHYCYKAVVIKRKSSIRLYNRFENDMKKGLSFTQFDKNTYAHNLNMRKLAQSQIMAHPLI